MSTTTGHRSKASVAFGRRVPSLVLRCAFAALVVVLCWALAPPGFWFVVCLLSGLTAATIPRTYAAWVFAFAIGLTAFAHSPDPGDWRAYVTLAGIHLVHLLGSVTVVAPARSSVQLSALARPALGFLLIQFPCQALLAVALVLARAQRDGAFIQLGLLAPFAAAAVLGLALLLVLPFTRRDRTARQRR